MENFYVKFGYHSCISERKVVSIFETYDFFFLLESPMWARVNLLPPYSPKTDKVGLKTVTLTVDGTGDKQIIIIHYFFSNMYILEGIV